MEWQVISLQPDWMKGRVSSERYKEASAKLSIQKRVLATYSSDVNKAAAEFEEKRLKLEKAKDASLEECMKDDLVFIMNLNINYLPLETQIEYVRIGFIEDLKEAELQRCRIDKLLRDLQERALQEYLDNTFERSKYFPVM